MFAWNFFKSPFCSWSCSRCCGGCLLLHLLQQLHYSHHQHNNRRKGMQVLLGLRQAWVKSTWAATADRPQCSMTKWLANREAIHRWRWRWWRRRRQRWKWRGGPREAGTNRVLNSKGTHKSWRQILLMFTTSPTFLTATTTTSTLKCRSQKSWHSDLVCFLCNKRNFQKEFLFVFFLKDYSNFKRNYYFILVTLYCQYIWPVYLVHLSPKR